MKAKNSTSVVVGMVILVLILVGVVYAAVGLTDVRVGPTAAIGIACSADGKTVFVVHGNGFFKSIDGGETWTKMPVK